MSPFLTCVEKLSTKSILTRLEVFQIVLELSVNPYHLSYAVSFSVVFIDSTNPSKMWLITA